MAACIDCETDCGADRLCAPCLTRRVTAERTAQGLPPTVTDPDVLAHIERISRPAHGPIPVAS